MMHSSRACAPSGGGCEELLLYIREEDPIQLDAAGALVEDYPQFVPVMVVLAREDGAWGYGDDLHSRGQVVGVLLEPSPRLLYLY